MKVDRAVTLPFTCEQIFDLAADIERYPEFLPGWISARILSRAVDQLEVEQVLGIGPARVQFRSRAVLHRPKQIAVTSSEPPFRHYGLTWLLAPEPIGSCHLRVVVDLELDSGLLQQLVNRILPASIDQVVAIFEARANKLYMRRDG